MRSSTGTPRSRLGRSVVVFAGALAIQAGIIIFAGPGRTQVPPPTGNCAPNCITVTIDSVATLEPSELYQTVYTIDSLSGRLSNTIFVGQLSGSPAQFSFVETNQPADINFEPITYTVTTFDASSPFIITNAAFALTTSGDHFQNLDLLISNTSVANVQTGARVQAPPLRFTYGFRYPGLTQAGIFSDTYIINARSSGITETLMLGQITDDMSRYLSIDSQGVFCDQTAITAFVCTTSSIGAGPAVISATIQSLQPGQATRFLGVADLGTNESFAFEFKTDLQDPFVPPEPPLITLNIDVRPLSDRNPINPGSRGKIPVAIFSTPDRDVVNEVDTASLAFGRTGLEPSLFFCNTKDVNTDGLLDLLCLFDTATAAFQHGDKEAILTGKLFSGIPTRGTDSIVTVPRRRP